MALTHPATTSTASGPAPRSRAARRAWIVAGLALASLLVGKPADAWVPTPNRPKAAAPAPSDRRYVPARSHADPASGHDPIVALVLGGSMRRSVAQDAQQGRRLATMRERGHTDLATLHSISTTIRDIHGLPSHWGATHLSI